MQTLRPLKLYIRRHGLALIAGVLFVLLANALAMVIPLLIGGTVNLIEKRAIDSHTLFLFAVGIVCLAGVAGCFRFLMRRVLIDVSRDIEYEFRNELFRKLQTLDATFFDNHNTGDLMSRTTNDLDALRMLIGPAVMYSANTIFGLPIALTMMLVLDWNLTLIAMLPMLALPPLVKYFGSRTHKFSRLQQDTFGDLTTMVQENLAGIRVVKAYRQEAFEREKFDRRNADYVDKSLKLAWLQSFFFPSIRLIVNFGYVLLILVAGHQIIQKEMQIGTFFTFLLLFSGIVWPLIAAGWVVNLIQRGFASLDRIGLILDAKPATVGGVDRTKPETFDVEFRHLTFQYDGTDRPQLKDINLTIPAGHTLGIVGPVGSGKSTLIHLLANLYLVPRGMVFIGGRDVNDWPLEELRRRIALVFQETFLFSDTIGWNIRFGAEDGVTDDRVTAAARQAQVHDNIAAFPKQYQTVLGERGVNLSGGQKQRVAIARALIRNSDVLILDDALSAVDTHTEEAILRELSREMKGKTCFLISHRISTVAMADEIIVLIDGAIAQRGSHEQLLQETGMYAELYRKQLSEAALEQLDEAESWKAS